MADRAILDMRGTGSFTAQERPTNFREKILREYPDGPSPFMMLLGMLKSEATDDTKFNTFEQSIPDQVHLVEDTLSASGGSTGSAATDQYFLLDDTNYTSPADFFKPGHICRVEDTGEIVLVKGKGDGAAAGTELYVVRDVGSSATYGDGTSLAADAAGSNLTIIGSAHEEGANYPTAVHYSPSEFWNYIETFRTSLMLTDDAAQTYYRTGDINANAKFDAAVMHSMEMEKAFFWGRRERVDTLTGYPTTGVGANGQPMRTTGGVKWWIDQAASPNYLDGDNLTTPNTLTRDEFLAFLEPIYTVSGGSQNKLMFCGSTLLGVMTKYAEELGQIFLEPKDKTYGLQIRTLVHAWGELRMVNHPLFSEHPDWRKAGVIIDTRNVMYRYLKGRDTRFLRERQGNGEDMVVHEFMTKAGLELRFARTHGYLTGVSDFSAS